MYQNESELSCLFWETLETQYGLQGGTLYEYLILRSFTPHIQKGKIPPIDKRDLSRKLLHFLLDEWRLFNKTCRYLEEEIVFNETLYPITNDWHARYAYLFYEGNFENDIVQKWNLLLKKARMKKSKWTRKIFYRDLLQQAYLKELNASYHVTNETESVLMEEFVFPDDAELPPVIRLEVKLERSLHPHLSFESHGELLTEEKLESYLYQNLELIEDGLRPIERQYMLDKGRIDILAKDKEGKMVVVEVKVESDTDLVWQESYYTEELEKRFGVGNIRFIAIVPKYEPHIMNNISQKSHCQIFSFNSVMKGTVLENIHLKEEGVMVS